MGSGYMITPVENGSTSWLEQPRSVATAAQLLRAYASPSSPVPALALPALTSSARTALPRSRCSRQTVTGAAQKRFFVNSPAACAPEATLISSKSSRDHDLIRAAAVPSVYPAPRVVVPAPEA